MGKKDSKKVAGGQPIGRIFIKSMTSLAAKPWVGQSWGVTEVSFHDAALVVLAHGTDLNKGSAAPVFQHAAELRGRKIFGTVREAFWKQEPQVKDVLAQIHASRIFIAPLFISEGYFGDQIIPQTLGFDASRVIRTGSDKIFYCQPIGTHPAMTQVILSRAESVVKQNPFPRTPKPKETTLFIAGHGTEKNANSRRAIDHQADILREHGIYADVHTIFMEEEPRIGDCHRLARTRNCVVVPLFISDGLHVVEDIPVLLGEPEAMVRARHAAGKPTWRNPTEKHGKLFWYSSSVGTDPGVAEVILQRVKEAADGG